MEKIIKELVTIKSSAENMRKMTTAALCIAGLVCVGSVAAALHFTASRLSDIYVLDHGSAFTASVGEEDSQRELEVQDHVARFHELLLNLSPSSEAIRTNIDRALAPHTTTGRTSPSRGSTRGSSPRTSASSSQSTRW